MTELRADDASDAETVVGSAFRRTEPAQPALRRWALVSRSRCSSLRWFSGVVGVQHGTPPPTASDVTRLRLAVLPIANRTGDTSPDYVIDGLTDELIARLGASTMRWRAADDQ